MSVNENEIKQYGKYIKHLGIINDNEITMRAYRINMSAHYMLSTLQFPVCSLQFMYARNIVTGFLFNIFIYFVLDKFKNTALKNAKSYIGATVYGRYVLILDSEGEINKETSQLYDEMCEKYSVEELAPELNDISNEEDIINKIKTYTDEKKTFYKQLIDGTCINCFRSIDVFLNNYLLPIYKNKHFNGMLQFGLDVRHRKRIKEYKSYDKEYILPTKILQISKCHNDPSIIDKFLGIDDNSNSDSE